MRCISLLLVLFILMAHGTASALSAEQKTIYAEGINYFDIDSGTDVAACGSSALVGSSNEAKVWNYLSGKGLSAIAVAGIMGNMVQENGTFDPANKQANSIKPASTDPNVTGAALGIFQWDGGRRVAVMQALDKAGLSKYYGQGFGNPSLDGDTNNIPQADMDKMLTTELEFAWSGDTTKISDLASKLNAAKSVAGSDGSAELFNALFERSGDTPKQVQERVTSAGTFLKKYGGSGGSTGGCGALGGVSSLQDAIPYAKKFASDTVAKYHATAIDLHQKKDGNNIDMYQMSHSGGGSGTQGCWGASDCGQCVAASGWFVTMMTKYPFIHGNGNAIVGNEKGVGVKTGTNPEPFSVFSTSHTSTPEFGHTGVVLGVLGGGVVITLEDNIPDGVLSIKQYNIKQAWPDVTFAYVGDKLKPGIQ